MISYRGQNTNVNICPLCACALTLVELAGRKRAACPNCEFVHWDNPKPVAVTLVPMDGGLVLVKRKFEPFVDWWCLPGGFMEPSEHPEEAAIREVYEETGLSIQIHRLLYAGSPGRGINVVVLFYLAKPATGILTPGDDASQVRVFKYNQLPTNIAFELHRQMVDRFFKSNNGTLLDAFHDMT